MTANLPDNTLSAIKDELYRGRKLPAIKLYREATHSGLVDGKLAIEQMEKEMRAESSERFLVPPSAQIPASIGWAVLVAALGVVAMAVYYFVEGHGGDKATASRISLALGVVMSLMITLQGCAMAMNRQNPRLANFVLFIAFLLTGLNVYRILHP